MALTQVTWSLIDTLPVSAADILDKTSAVNTSGKYAGLFVWDTTNNRLMRASGAADVDVWWVVDGSTSVTPV